jgi:uncharacterized protein with ParB-like and HNH nuclease domain
MSSGFQTPITIKDAIDHIDDGTYLLPAIQRKFVWSSDQIEVLFDSIMRGYPISSFMFWEVKKAELKNSFKFYRFLNEYRQFFKENNTAIDVAGYRDFFAVIDGQQRLTSIYLGIKGSYAEKLSKKMWKDSETNIPTKYLYLNLSNHLPEENERQMYYDFQFFTTSDYEKEVANGNSIWYRVNDILKFDSNSAVDNYIDNQGWLSKQFTKESIRKLYEMIFSKPLINYYLEDTQEIDTVLDIFIRTNSGGTSLSFSDLLMSIATASWTSDARKAMSDIVKRVFEISSSQPFLITKDFVLKTCLLIFSDSIKFQVKNFDKQRVTEFEENWGRVEKSIIESFTLLSNLGFNNHSLRAKNAVIPIIYYIYHHRIENDINSPIKYRDDKQLIKKWLCISLLKGVFGSQSDTVLSGLRKVIQAELADTSKATSFPFERIKEAFEKNPTKNLSLDDEFIEALLTTQKDSPECFPILALIYSHFNFNQKYHKDHLHCESSFLNIRREDYQTDEDFSFDSDRLNWNSIANLQLLNDIENMSKGPKPLEEWVNDPENKVSKSDKFIPDDVSLKRSDFKTFIEKRKELLKSHLKNMVN